MMVIREESDWRKRLALETSEYPQHADFSSWHMNAFRELTRIGRGSIYALVDADGEMLASAGAFHRDRMARFASVLTAKHARHRGYAGYLIATILAELADATDQALIVSTAGSAAERLYRSLGFTPIVSPRSLLVLPVTC